MGAPSFGVFGAHMPGRQDDVRERLFPEATRVPQESHIVFVNEPTLSIHRFARIVGLQPVPCTLDQSRLVVPNQAHGVKLLYAAGGASDDGVVDALNDLVAPGPIAQTLVVGELGVDARDSFRGFYFFSRELRFAW